MEKPNDDLRAKILTRLDRVTHDLELVLDGYQTLTDKAEAHAKAHEEIHSILDSHDQRITALENPPRPRRTLRRGR